MLLSLLLACAGDPENGAVLYDENCVACHGSDGRAAVLAADGTPASDLAEEVPELSDDAVIRVITEGEGAMEPIALSEDLARDVLAYLREKFP